MLSGTCAQYRLDCETCIKNNNQSSPSSFSQSVAFWRPSFCTMVAIKKILVAKTKEKTTTTIENAGQVKFSYMKEVISAVAVRLNAIIGKILFSLECLIVEGQTQSMVLFEKISFSSSVHTVIKEVFFHRKQCAMRDGMLLPCLLLTDTVIFCD